MSPLKKHPALAALIIIVLVGLAAGAVVLINKERTDHDEDDTTTSVQTESPASQPTSPSATSTAQYKDGTYTKSANYISPGGRESVTVGITLKGGVITDTTFSATASDRDARQYQSMFAGAYKSKVVGKSLNEVSLSRVAGSSLTTNSFNDALDQIKSDAKA